MPQELTQLSINLAMALRHDLPKRRVCDSNGWIKVTALLQELKTPATLDEIERMVCLSAENG